MIEIKTYCDMCKNYINNTEEVQDVVYVFECLVYTNFKIEKPAKTISGELCGLCINKVNIFLTGKRYYDK